MLIPCHLPRRSCCTHYPRYLQVFKPRLDKFIKDHADVFMLQEIETSGVEVLLLHRPGGGEGDAAEPPAGNAAESGGGGAPGADGEARQGTGGWL